MKKLIFASLLIQSFVVVSAQSAFDKGVQVIQTVTGGQGSNLSNTDIVSGLKEALNIGTKNASTNASAVDGFYKNSLIKIPFPPEVKMVETQLKKFGMTKATEDFVKSMNRAAEGAAKDAAPIFLKAITSMNINDGLTILKGDKTAATAYLKTKTSDELKTLFKPTVQAALQKAQVTKYWNPLMSRYNKIPMVRKVNPNLEDYVTSKALDGLFTLIGQEEEKIRTNPAARVSDILQRVFGN